MTESVYKNSRRLWNLICNFLLSRILWLQVVKCSNVRHFPSPSRICKCCGCVFFRGYHHIICHPLLKKGVPCVFKKYHWGYWGGGGVVYNSLWPRRGENSLTFSYIKSECPGQRGFKWLNYKRNSDLFFKVMRKRETKFKSVFQSNAKTKNENEIHIRFSKWCENEKRKLKSISVFQSDAKTKNEIRSSKPFFKVRRKRKTKSKIQICFSMPCENEKWIWHLNSSFPCHRKTVGTKVHAL